MGGWNPRWRQKRVVIVFDEGKRVEETLPTNLYSYFPTFSTHVFFSIKCRARTIQSSFSLFLFVHNVRIVFFLCFVTKFQYVSYLEFFVVDRNDIIHGIL